MMNKWQEIKDALKHLGGSATLLADGHELALRKVHNGKRIYVVVYVDGCLKGEWTSVEDQKPVHPEARFWRAVKRTQYNKKKNYSNLKRVFGKKEADQMVTPRVIGFVPDFGTEGAVVTHLKKHFPDLEITREAEAVEA